MDLKEYGEALLGCESFADALAIFTEVVDVMARVRNARLSSIVCGDFEMGRALLGLGRPHDALPHLVRCRELWLDRYGPHNNLLRHYDKIVERARRALSEA